MISYKAFDSLFGNDLLKSYFISEIEKKALSHAYILEGDEGSGKHTLALAVAGALASGVPEGEKIARGLSPDVLIYRPLSDKKQFTIDVVRKMREDVYVLPSELPFKFCLLEKSETMNVQAQNAALKILEEPPANTYFFLLCENAAMLLPTVRSRAPVLRMQRFSREELDELLSRDKEIAQKKKQNEEFYFSCLQNSCGSYGKARSLLQSAGSADGREAAREILARLHSRTELLLCVSKLPKTRPEFEEVLFHLQTALRDLMLLRACGGKGQIGGSGEKEGKTELFYFGTAEDAETLGEAPAQEQLLKAATTVEDLREKSKSNANVRDLQFALLRGLTEAFGL